MQARFLLLLLILLARPCPGLAGAAPSASHIRENLQYQVSLGVWGEVAKVNLLLKQMGPGRYLAEFNGAAQGAGKLVSQWLPERYQTEMVYDQGRLKPLVYREEFQVKGEHVRKEYRFDYQRGCLSIWRQAGRRPMTKRYEIPLQGPVYDPLSLFYNLRLGNLGPLTSGASLRVAAVPVPEPQEIIIRIGPETPQGRKMMMTWGPPGNGNTPYFVYLNKEGVPTSAWARIGPLSKLAGELANPEEIVKEGLLGPVSLPLAELKGGK